jgi:L-threonylcarbamoyladenylate synthase
VPATQVLLVNPVTPERDVIAHAADCLRRGGLVAFPTETVYGLGAHALDRDALRRLFAAKGRPSTDPLIVHVGSLDAATALVAQIPSTARVLADRFWPGPLTLVMRRSTRVPDEVTAGLDTVAVRVTAHPVARALITAAGVPVAAPSANLFSRPSPTRAEHVLADLCDRVDLVLDGGPTTVGVESTVLDLSTAVPTILRPGAVTLEMLRSCLPHVERRAVPDADVGTAAASPGLLSKHYAPATPLSLYRGAAAKQMPAIVEAARRRLEAGDRVVVLTLREEIDRLRTALGDPPGLVVIEVGSRAEPASVATRLYAAIREADAAGAAAILVCDTVAAEGQPADAIRDRLRRAAAIIEEV